MKINEVEQLVGVTKRNIRFYEKEGLLSPGRTDNGYRDYGEADVEALRKIKLLRKLDVPLEEIRRMQQGTLTLTDGVRRHIIQLERAQDNLATMRSLCQELAESGEQLASLDAGRWLEKMERMEEGGTQFMNIRKNDIVTRYGGTVAAALVFVALMGGLIALMVWGLTVEPAEAPPLGLMLFLLAIPGVVIIGGIQSIASVCEKLVPFMALTYVVLALGVVLLNLPRLPEVFTSIVAGAFNPAAFTGGAVGSLFLSMQKGVSRGIFSNEAGLGTGSIAHACADTKKPVKQGVFGIFEVFADTIVICTLTAMVILCSGVPVNYGAAAGAELTISGFTTTYGGWASIFTAVALCCFAFSTIIGWGLYGSRFIAFLCRSDKVVRPFFVVYSFVSILGATVDLGLLWSIADTFNGLMSIPNLIALLLLSGTVVELTKDYFAKEKV